MCRPTISPIRRRCIRHLPELKIRVVNVVDLMKRTYRRTNHDDIHEPIVWPPPRPWLGPLMALSHDRAVSSPCVEADSIEWRETGENALEPPSDLPAKTNSTPGATSPQHGHARDHALRGDRTLFGTQAGVEAAWRIVEPILNRDEPPHEYDGGSRGPAEAERIAAPAGCWIEPDLVTELATTARSSPGPAATR